MARPRDSQRSAVYGWERSLPGWPGAQLTLAGCQDLVCEIWALRGRGGAPLVRDGRGRRHAAYVPSVHEIRLPRWSRSRMIVLHETAHALLRERRDLAWHGPEFARLYLDLLYRHEGLDLSVARSLATHRRPRRVRFSTFAAIPEVRTDAPEIAPAVVAGAERLLF